MTRRQRVRFVIGQGPVQTRPAMNGVEQGQSHDGQNNEQPKASERLSIHLDDNRQILSDLLKTMADVIFRDFETADALPVLIVFLNGLCDTKQIENDIMRPLSNRSGFTDITHLSKRLPIANISIVSKFDDAVDTVLSNHVLVLIDGHVEGLSLSVSGGQQRAIEEPATEAVIQGPREGFNEDAQTSVSLIRRRLPTSDLKIESHELGTYTKTQIAVCYIEGIVDPTIVDEVRKRMERIEIDGILDAGYIEELIEDAPFSPFPQLQSTERPDVAAACLLEGRVVVVVDRSPFALIMPVNLWGALTAAEDYYERFFIANAIRFLRCVFVLFALTLPATYVAITTFHQELLPSKMLLSVAAAREVTPFPAVVECLIMEVTFEALREAGVRLPKTIGSSISIVGALVIGQAAVQAGIVSAPMVIVVSITGIASFCIPRYNFAIAIRLLRFPIIIMAGMFGLFGIIVCVLAILIHLSSLRSLGVPYLEPIAPFNLHGMKDTLIRVPRWKMGLRPLGMVKDNLRRQSRETGPNPPTWDKTNTS